MTFGGACVEKGAPSQILQEAIEPSTPYLPVRRVLTNARKKLLGAWKERLGHQVGVRFPS